MGLPRAVRLLSGGRRVGHGIPDCVGDRKLAPGGEDGRERGGPDPEFGGRHPVMPAFDGRCGLPGGGECPRSRVAATVCRPPRGGRQTLDPPGANLQIGIARTVAGSSIPASFATTTTVP